MIISLAIPELRLPKYILDLIAQTRERATKQGRWR